MQPPALTLATPNLAVKRTASGGRLPLR